MLDLNEIFTATEVPSSMRDVAFSFNAHQAKEYMQTKINQRNKLAERLERLISEPRVAGQPLIEYILKSFPQATPEELSTVAQALQRISELMGKWKEINDEVNGLIWTANNAERVALAFGDFQTPDPDYFINQDD